MGKIIKIREVGELVLNKMSEEVDIININNDILEIMKEKYVDAYLCVLEIKKYVKQKYDYILEDEEILFLTIHVAKIILKK